MGADTELNLIPWPKLVQLAPGARLMRSLAAVVLGGLMTVGNPAHAQTPPTNDWRDVANGHCIPDENYADQPYTIVNKDGSWLTVITTGPGSESKAGQHVVCTVSRDKGDTWSDLSDIEPSKLTDGSWAPPASWANPLVTPDGSVYVFYNYNGDRVDFPGPDTLLGWMVFRYSDDGGLTWSRRQRVDMPRTRVDLNNTENGKVQRWWQLGKPIIVGSRAYGALTKLRSLSGGGEGWIWWSDNPIVA